jgi:hypothetical protein
MMGLVNAPKNDFLFLSTPLPSLINCDIGLLGYLLAQ